MGALAKSAPTTTGTTIPQRPDEAHGADVSDEIAAPTGENPVQPGRHGVDGPVMGRRSLILGLVIAAIVLAALSAASVATRRADAAAARDRDLLSAAQAGAAVIDSTFARSRDLLTLATASPTYRAFYADPRPRAVRLRDATATAPVVAALEALGGLHPGSIGEACFIDADGSENARVVRGRPAAPTALSTNERANLFFAPTLALSFGSVYQAVPYRSSDTHEWVVSSSAVIVDDVGRRLAMVHYEVTVESYREAIASVVGSTVEADVIDRVSGRSVIDSRKPQRVDAVLGFPAERQWRSFRTGPLRPLSDVGGERIATAPVPVGADNANRWFVAASAPLPDTVSLSGAGPTAIALLGSALLLLVGSVIAARRGRALTTAELKHARAAGEAAEERSRTDPLTGLLNRRGCLEALTGELHRASRGAAWPGVFLLDADRFKRVNDTYGHQAGDDVLIEVARRLRAAVREYDTVARWGGEEFCVVVAEIGDEDALRTVGETLRRAVEACPIGAGTDLLLPVTVSGGAVRASEALSTPDLVVDAADRALYAAKRRGRNQIRLFAEMTVEDFVAEEPEAMRLAQALALSAAVREGMPELHSQQVADLSGAIATELALNDGAALRVRLTGWLHDVGKVAIPDRILAKRGPLDDDDWTVMRAHAEIGEQIILRVAGLADAAAGVRGHHERWDGGGYPDGLAGEAIPLEARIVAAADAFSAITSDRPYHAGQSLDEAIVEIRRSAGSHLDPTVVEALVRALHQQRSAAATRLGSDVPPMPLAGT
jgi:diguanylate cyclase (GGDEF)-like protein